MDENEKLVKVYIVKKLISLVGLLLVMRFYEVYGTKIVFKILKIRSF